jgi:hypothetical protein
VSFKTLYGQIAIFKVLDPSLDSPDGFIWCGYEYFLPAPRIGYPCIPVQSPTSAFRQNRSYQSSKTSSKSSYLKRLSYPAAQTRSREPRMAASARGNAHVGDSPMKNTSSSSSIKRWTMSLLELSVARISIERLSQHVEPH